MPNNDLALLLAPFRAAQRQPSRRLDTPPAATALTGLDKAKHGPYAPIIPCWTCMRSVAWEEAVVTGSGTEQGFGHATGLCDPTNVALVTARNAGSIYMRAAA